MAGIEDVPLQTALDRLAESDILLVEGLPPEASYRFKHALIADAAYENLLRSRRQVLHRRVAEALRDDLVGTAAAEPELLAHHFTQAGLIDEAIERWDKAGQLAAGRSTMAEAAVHFGQALQLVASLPKSRQLRSRERALQLGLAATLMAAKGWASPQAGDAYARARELCQEAPEGPQLVAALSGVFTCLHNRAEFVGGGRVAEELLVVARRQNDRDAKLLAHRARQRKKEKFTALLHHVGVDLLGMAFFALKRDAAPGVDGLTWRTYEADLDRNLTDLHERVHRGAYRALPSRRTYIPKADGKQRPLAVAALEDKIVQRATVAVLNAIYEEDFLG